VQATYYGGCGELKKNRNFPEISVFFGLSLAFRRVWNSASRGCNLNPFMMFVAYRISARLQPLDSANQGAKKACVNSTKQWLIDINERFEKYTKA
jgi:hypothetical protein